MTPRGRCYPRSLWLEVEGLYRDGWTLGEIEMRFGISPPAIYQHMKRYGIVRESEVRKRTPPGEGTRSHYQRKPEFDPPPLVPEPAPLPTISYTQTASEIVRLHRAGVSRTRIAALLRMPYRSIDAALSLFAEAAE